MGKYRYLSNLEIPAIGTEKEQEVIATANAIMNLASLREKKNKNDQNTEALQNLVSIICTDPEYWTSVENKILNNIENYINNGYEGSYNFDDNDVCNGSLKLLTIAYQQAMTMGAEYVQKQRVDTMLEQMKAVNQKAIEEAELF